MLRALARSRGSFHLEKRFSENITYKSNKSEVVNMR